MEHTRAKKDGRPRIIEKVRADSFTSTLKTITRAILIWIRQKMR